MGYIRRFDDVKKIQKLSSMELVAYSSGKYKGQTRSRKRLKYWLFQVAKIAISHAEKFKKLHVLYNKAGQSN